MISKLLRTIQWTLVLSFVVLAFVSFVAYRRDSERLRELASSLAPAEGSPSAQMRAVTRYVTEEISPDRSDDWFLLPVFAPLRPTACQIIDEGGDCAYKARAFIVLLDKLGIEASKLCLYDDEGVPQHAVARVSTERGDYVVDLLFGIVFDHDDGSPMAVEEIAESLPTVIERERGRGNSRVERYPLETYSYNDVATINWEKGPLWRAAYRGLSLLLGEERVARMPRPYLSEEPALMVIVASLAGVVLLLGAGPVARLLRRVFRRRPRRATGSEPEQDPGSC